MFQASHDILPSATHDEFARQEFCATLRRVFTTELWPANREVYDQKQLPAFTQKHGRPPQSFREARALMEETFYWRCTNLIGRAAQELLWDTVGESVERQLDELNARAAAPSKVGGSLRVNPQLKMPKYIEAVDIHAMPGNFQTELTGDDVFAGALYDRGVYVFSYGGLGPKNEGLGVTMSGFLKKQFPDFEPQRILDIGCGPGFTTVPFVDAYPKAEVHAIDIGAPQVRYAHRRAESLGKKIHFSQQDGTRTDYEDGHFDLVYTCLVLHECPVPVIRAIFKEAHRLLRPGGIMLHDGGTMTLTDPGGQLMTSFFGHNANEPFAVGMVDLDYRAAFVEAGFDESRHFEGRCPPAYLKEQLKFVSYVGSIKT